MNRSTVILVSAILLASCGERESPAPPVQNEVIVRSEAQQRLFDLNDLDRAIALKHAIADQGLNCAQIVTTGYVTRYRDMDMWTATCSDERQWAFFIAANDSVQIRLCADNVKIGLPECKIQPGTEGGTGLEKVNLVNVTGT